MPEPKMYSAQDIAKYFIWKSHQESKPITNKKLQKLLYYAQAWSLALNNEPLFNDQIEAWIHGPAIPLLYREYKRFGYQNINIADDQEVLGTIIGTVTERLLNSVWKIYGKYDSLYLEKLSHSESPWQLAREEVEDGESSTNIISLESMRSFYKDML